MDPLRPADRLSAAPPPPPPPPQPLNGKLPLAAGHRDSFAATTARRWLRHVKGLVPHCRHRRQPTVGREPTCEALSAEVRDEPAHSRAALLSDRRESSRRGRCGDELTRAVRASLEESPDNTRSSPR